MALLKTTSQRGKQGATKRPSAAQQSNLKKSVAKQDKPSAPVSGAAFSQNRGQVYKGGKLVADYGIGEEAAAKAQTQASIYQNKGKSVRYGVNTESFYSPDVRSARKAAATTDRSVRTGGANRPILNKRAPVKRDLAAEQAALQSALESNTKGGANTGIPLGTDINSLSAAQKSLLQESINMRAYGTANPEFLSDVATSTTQRGDTSTGSIDGTVDGAIDTTTQGTTPSNTSGIINRPVYDGASQEALGSSYLSDMPEQPKSLQEIRQDTLARSQEMVNATEAYFTSQISELDRQATAQKARYGSMAVGAGLAGSPFQQTIDNSITEEQNQQAQAIKAQRSAEVAGYVNDAYNRADTLYQQGLDEYQEERDFAVSERDKAIAQQEKKQEATKKAALETIGSIATSGYSLDEMPNDQYKKLLRDANMSDFEARAIWAAKTPQANASYTTQGDMLVQQYFDPHTQKFVVKTTKLPPELMSQKVADIQTFDTPDGQVYWYDANNPLNTNGSFKATPIGGVKAVNTVSVYDELLSPTEAEKLGVPYGTTVGEAVTFGITPESITTATEKTLSAEATKTQAIVKSGLDALSQLESLLTNNEGLFGRPLLASGTYKAAEDNLIDVIGRLRSGGAVTPEEKESFSTLLPERLDSQKTVEYKLKQIKDYLTEASMEASSPQNGLSQEDRQYIIDQGGDPDAEDFSSAGGDTIKSDISSAVQSSKVKVKGKIQPLLTTSTVKLGNKTVTVNSAVSNRLAMADRDYFAATGKHIPVSESFRTAERQKELFKKLSARGARVAPQGYSFHELGMAVDVGDSWKDVKPYMNKYGFINGLKNDMGHFSVGELS